MAANTMTKEDSGKDRRKQSFAHHGHHGLGISQIGVQKAPGHPRKNRTHVETDDAQDGDEPTVDDVPSAAGRHESREKLRGTEKRKAHTEVAGHARESFPGEPVLPHGLE